MALFGSKNATPPPQPPNPAPAPPVSADTGAGVPAIPSVAAVAQLGASPMTASMARNVRFNTSEPSGYFFPQVEEYVEQVTKALEWYENLRYQMERALHDLQEECDHQTYDAQRLRTEIELFKVQGSPVVNADGSYKTESQQAAEAGAAEHIAALEAQLAATTSRITELEAEIARAHAYIANQDEQVAHFRAETEAAVAARDEALAQAADATQRLAEAQARLSQTDQVILTLQQENERLQVALTAAVQPGTDPRTPAEPVPTAAPAPVDPDPYGPVADSEPVAVIPVESELPPGTVVPPAPSAAGYSPAQPGAPLGTHGVPAHVWAPELGTPADPDVAVDPDAIPQPTLHPHG